MHTEGTDPPRGPVPNPSTAQSGLKHHTVISVRGTSHGCQRRAGQQKRYSTRADRAGINPGNIEARPSASGARRRSYTRGSEVGDRCRPSLKP